MENYQFRYDGSPEAKECIREINRVNRVMGEDGYQGELQSCYTNDFYCTGLIFHEYDILTPAEFLARFKADHPVTNEWQPKVGEEYQIYQCGKLIDAIYRIKIGEWYVLDLNGEVLTAKTMQKKKPSVREQVIAEMISRRSTNDIADRIIEIVKGESDK